METTTPNTWTSSTAGEPIAAYETAHGAELALERLVQEGFAPEDLAVRPLDTQPLPGWRERARRQDDVRLAGATTVLAAATVVVAGAMSGWSVPIIVLLAMVVAVASGSMVVATSRWWTARVREHARNDRRLIAGVFEVRCRTDVARARRLLARWWNPAARPTAPDS
jgi:hypothetical protein